MKKTKVSFEVIIYEDLMELPSEGSQLMNIAVSARENAYAPYSEFQVGAAVLLENGEIVMGSNQENASYPAGLCAEGVAVFQASARFPGITIKMIAISAASKKHTVRRPAAPCGICRQAISEYEIRQKSPIKILMMGEEGEVYCCDCVADILPLGFDSSYL